MRDIVSTPPPLVQGWPRGSTRKSLQTFIIAGLLICATIALLRVYDVALSAQQVAELHNVLFQVIFTDGFESGAAMQP